MDAKEILEKYSLDREKAANYVQAITYLNQSEAAKQVNVSRQTINRYKKAFQKMTPRERLLLISTLTQEKLLNQATGWERITEAYQVGDRVKLILDKERGPDTHLHGKKGEIIDVEFDDAASVTGTPKDNFMYVVELENGEVPDLHFRRPDLKKLE